MEPRKVVRSEWKGSKVEAVSQQPVVERPPPPLAVQRHVEFAEESESVCIEENKEVFAMSRITSVKSERKEEKGKVRHDNSRGEAVFKDTPSHALVQRMKKGLKKSLESISATENRELNPKSDFTYKAKSQSPDDDYIFTSYSPLCYRHVREFLDTPPGPLIHDLWASQWKVSKAAKSSSLLYFAGPHYVIKTMNKEESQFLREIVHMYYHHIKYNPHTLLPRYYGHFSVKLANGDKVSFVIMNNVFDTGGGKKVSVKYDLKGSKVGRIAEPSEQILKDLDLKSSIQVGEKRKQILLEQIYRDTDFLHQCRIMDYSFLLGIVKVDAERLHHNLPLYVDERCIQADEGGMLSQSGDEIYYAGIIDILQEYTTRKKAENFFRGLRYKRDEISAVPPGLYKRRFNEFLESKIR